MWMVFLRRLDMLYDGGVVLLTICVVLKIWLYFSSPYSAGLQQPPEYVQGKYIKYNSKNVMMVFGTKEL